jgi:AcrR family transcriptional regulator
MIRAALGSTRRHGARAPAQLAEIDEETPQLPCAKPVCSRFGAPARRIGRVSASSIPPRRAPRQVRSRAIVEAIVQAGRELLASDGARSLTTNRIAERAGVSIGSLYRYFPNKDAVLAAIYEAETGREVADIRAASAWEIDEAPLHQALATIVDFQLERQRRLLALGRDFYRVHHSAFSLGARVGRDELEQHMRQLLERQAASVRVRDPAQAAFLIARGLSAIVRKALEERPEKLYEPAFRDELVDLAVCYVTAPRPER